MSVLLAAGLLLPISIGTRAGQPEVSPVAARFPSIREQVRLTLPDASAEAVLARLDAFARTDPAFESLDYVLCEEHFRKRRTPNYALLLFVHLLDRNPEAANDTMSAAIALANNYYYPNGDPAVRRLILADVDAQWKFYVRLVAWQARISAPAPLARMPIEAKVVWAARERTYAPTRNQKDYIQRLPRIEEIESMHEVVAKETGLAEARSLAQWSARIQKWFLSQRVPRSKLPPDKQHIFFSDLYAYYRAEKRFPTKHCVATATFFWVIYRSVGMPVFTYYQNFRTAGTDGSGVLHEWPAYYDPDRRIWESGQKSNHGGTTRASNGPEVSTHEPAGVIRKKSTMPPDCAATVRA